jgi:pyroglutamyl-peptidase
MGAHVTVVVQGFEPFAEHATNPSQRLVAGLASESREGVVAEVLTTSRACVARAVPELVARHRPSTWLGVGLAAGRSTLCVEAAAVNLADWTVADADGAVAEREPVRPDGSAAHLTTLPVAGILDAWRSAGIPGQLSLSAGSYICNLSFYLAAQTVAELGLDCRVGFIHVPLSPEMVEAADAPSMSMSMMSHGLDLAIEASRHASGDAGLYVRRTP